MPKFVINSSGDQFFLCDSAQFYFKDLPAPKHLYYNPNTITPERLAGDKVLLAWYMAILAGARCPNSPGTSPVRSYGRDRQDQTHAGQPVDGDEPGRA